jgi:hypothetical protein
MRALVVLLCGLASTSWAEAPSAFTASAGVGFLNRSFTWNGDNALTPASQPFAGAVAVDTAWFPGAHVTQGPGSWFGIFGQGDFGLGLSSRLAYSQAVFAQTATRLRFGALARFPASERFAVLVHLGYARQGFSTSSSAVSGTAVRPNAPDVLIEGPRAGVGARIGLGGSVQLDLLTGFQWATGLGELGSATWFPSSTAFGVDVGLGLSFGLVEHVRLRLSGDWQRTFVTLGGNAKWTADSAAEQYISAAVTLQWAM